LNIRLSYVNFGMKALDKRKATYDKDESDILARQKVLKDDLYGRFGSSINLES
jgi:hypothetical protein